jgi:hypothetical protein
LVDDKELAKGILSGTSETLYTAPAGVTGTNAARMKPSAKITEILVCNTDTVARTFTLYIVESGGSIGADRAIFSGVPLVANQTAYLEMATVMPAASTLRGLADSTNKVSYRVTGIERQ